MTAVIVGDVRGCQEPFLGESDLVLKMVAGASHCQALLVDGASDIGDKMHCVWIYSGLYLFISSGSHPPSSAHVLDKIIPDTFLVIAD